jgi:hypothetical protein
MFDVRRSELTDADRIPVHQLLRTATSTAHGQHQRTAALNGSPSLRITT